MKEIEASSLKNIIDTFPFSGEPISIKSTDTGLINSTYMLTFSDGLSICSAKNKYECIQKARRAYVKYYECNGLSPQ